MQISEQSVVAGIRGSRSFLAKKRHQPKTRPGVYGKNLDDAIQRLARQLSAPVGAVSVHVMRLRGSGTVEFVRNRLVVTKDKPASILRRASLPATLITGSASDEQNLFGIPQDKSYLLSAFADLFAAEVTPA